MRYDDSELIASTKEHEGFREHTYICSRGAQTIGYGTNLDAGISREQAEALMVLEYKHILGRLHDKYRWFDHLSDGRKRALMEMAYQLGLGGLDGFDRMLKAMSEGDFDAAAEEALDSKWCRQTPNRANHVASLLRAG